MNTARAYTPPARGTYSLQFALGTLSHNRDFSSKELSEYTSANGAAAVRKLLGHGLIKRVRPGRYYPTPKGWDWITGGGSWKSGIGDAARTRKPECHCIFRHPRTPEERAQVVKALHYARSIGDSQGTMVAMAQLGPCLSDKPSHTTRTR